MTVEMNNVNIPGANNSTGPLANRDEAKCLMNNNPTGNDNIVTRQKKQIIEEFKYIFLMILLAFLIIIGIFIIVKKPNCQICSTEPNTSTTASSSYQGLTPTKDMRIFPQEIHFDLLFNAMAVICEKKQDNFNDTLCLNVPVYDTTLGKKVKLKLTKYPEEMTETFHPYDKIPLQKGTYLVQFEMSIFRHVKYKNATDGPFHYGVTLKLDEKPLVRCVHGLLGNLSSSETENCSFIPTPIQKYTIDLDDIFTYVKSKVVLEIVLSVEKPESNLTLMFGKEGFVDKGVLIVKKL